MYCKIVFKGRPWATYELYRDVIAKGERSAMRLFYDRKVEAVRVFDTVVYALTQEDITEIENCGNYITEDLDTPLAAIKKVKRKDTDIHVTEGISVYGFGGFVFVRLADIAWRGTCKYNHVRDMAVLRIGRKIFVALNARNTSSVHPIVFSK